MFDSLVRFSLKNRGAVLFVTVMVCIWGTLAFQDLTIEAFPDPTDTQVNVITLYNGQPAEEVERQIGLPLERSLNGTPGLSRLRNTSMFGLSYITLTFYDGIDGLAARQQVLERLRDVDLPDGVIPELGPFATPIGEIYRYTITGASDDPMKLRTLQEWVVRPAFLRVRGVADVVTYGGLVREVHVLAKPARMASFGLSMVELEEAIKKGSVNASGGILERGAEQFVIRSEGMFTSLDDLRMVRVATHDGTPVFLSDVADITDGWSPRQGVVSRGEQYDAVQGIVLMRRGENPSEVLKALAHQIELTNKRLAFEGATISPFYDRTDLVNTTLKTVGHSLLEGAILVVLVLFVFLLDLRAALITATLIPVSLLTAFIYLKMRGMSANLLSLGAVDFGVIVDGGVVIIEAILARLNDHDGFTSEEAPREHAFGVELTISERVTRATLSVVRPTVFALLIIIAAYLPIFMLQRVEARIFAPMAHTVVAALLGALVFSVTLVPVLAAMAYRKPVKHGESPVLRLAAKAYAPALRFSLKRPFVVVAASVALLVGTGFVVPHLGSEFLPSLNEGALYMTFNLPSNTSLTEGRKLVPELTRLIEANPQVESTLSQLGRPEDGTDATLTNSLAFFVRLKPPDEWPKSTPELADVIDVLNQSISGVPGLEVNFSQPIADNVNDSVSGQIGQVALKIYGDDLVSLQAQAERAKTAIAAVTGAADVGLVKSGEIPQIRVVPNRNAMARYGIDLGDFQHFFQTATGGQPVSEFWDGERKFDVVIRLPLGARDDVEKIRKLRVPTDDGSLVPVDALARVDTGFGRAAINRENGRRYIGIRMNVRGRDLGSFVTDAQTAVEKDAPLKPGMTMEWGGEFESKDRAMKRLLLVVPVALVITLLLLFKAFDSMGLAVITLLNVPFALTGGILGLWVFGMPVSVAAAVGFIALIGQASLNGVLVASAIAHRRESGASIDDAIMQGARDKLRPVLMTAALAALGLVPAAMSHGIGSETQRPLAVVIVFGTISACLLTLMLLPVAFKLTAPMFERAAAFRRRRIVPVSESKTTHVN